jgi:hypothetical protein
MDHLCRLAGRYELPTVRVAVNNIWIGTDALQSMTNEADRRYPLETGGVLDKNNSVEYDGRAAWPRVSRAPGAGGGSRCRRPGGSLRISQPQSALPLSQAVREVGP